jgi:hypothetical protein
MDLLKIKNKLQVMHTIKAWRRRGIPSLIPKFRISQGEWPASSAWLLYHWGKSPQYPLNRILCGSQTHSGCFGGEKHIFCLPCGPLIYQLSICSLIIILTTLCWLPLPPSSGQKTPPPDYVVL